MKKTILLISALFGITASVHTQSHTVEATSDIQTVTVFLSGAEVTRQSTASLKTGENEVVFSGLEKNIRPTSIQVSAPEEVIILSVNHYQNYLTKNKQSPRIEVLEDSLKILGDLKKRTAKKKEVLEMEEGMILANQKLSGTENAVSVEELRRASEFFRDRLGDISDRLFLLAKETESHQKREKRIRNELKQLNYQKNKPTYDIVVTLNSDRNQPTKLKFKYLVQDAYWTPRYDLRVKDVSKPVALDYRGDIWQNTGTDWENVMLTLSTANPSLGGNKPSLNPWYLSVYEPPTVYRSAAQADVMGSPKKAKMEEMEMAEAEPAFGSDMEYDDFDGASNTLANYTQVVQTTTNAEFRINLRQSIPSDGKQHQVQIQKHDLPAAYEYASTPKLDDDAFLFAHVTDWEGLNLLEGKTNIYFEGTFVGESYINPQNTEDTLSFSLGRDQNIVIKREQLKNFNKEKTLGFNRERTYAFQINVRNTKQSLIKISLEDQIPVSQDDDINVTLEESSGAKHNKQTGKLVWDLELKPQESREIKFTYSVKHPKNKQINNLR